MKAYYICPIIGTGTDLDPYRSKVSNYNVNMAVIASGYKNWCVTLVNANDHSAILADSQIFFVSDDITLTTFGSLSQQYKKRITDALSYVGITYTPKAEDTLEYLLNLFINELNPNGSVSQVNVKG